MVGVWIQPETAQIVTDLQVGDPASGQARRQSHLQVFEHLFVPVLLHGHFQAHLLHTRQGDLFGESAVEGRCLDFLANGEFNDCSEQPGNTYGVPRAKTSPIVEKPLIIPSFRRMPE